MEITKDMLNKLSGMSDEQLKGAIAEIAEALGASPSQKRMAMNNVGLLRRKVMNSSDKDLQRFLSKVSPEKQAELKKKLKL